jgi:uncharacterized protein (UPF0248 family)
MNKNTDIHINFKSKFPRDILNEVKWKGCYDLSKCTICYINRGSPDDTAVVEGKQIIEIDKGFLILEGDPYERYIPYHRIIRIEYEDTVIFEKP